ncbi:MAG TPA: DUF3863 domain-containing protein, partial [Dinghuibacter sp.]|uniref:DUF3863 domain-containing protein n=1 Tax=Dinghuibacter sp. TaxID=2024697 RepID=UPI002BB9B67F
MHRRDFCKDALLTGAALAGSPLLRAATLTTPATLMGHRFVTLCIMIRTSPWEVSRDVKLID